MASFFYSECPGICPLTTHNLGTVQERFQNDERVLMLSFSLTPEKDTPERLRRFAKKNHIDPKRWKLLTGDRKVIYQVARESFNADTFSERENSIQKLTPQDFLHSENVYLLDQNQKLRGIYQGRMTSSLEELTRDAESLFQ